MTEEENEAIENLKQYIEEDEIYNGDRKNLSDFDMFCIEHCTDIAILLNSLEKKDRIIDEVQKEIRQHIGFENRLKKDNRKPDLFNQGRFYVANNINNILKERQRNTL